MKVLLETRKVFVEHCAEGVEDIFLTGLATVAIGEEATFVEGDDYAEEIYFLATFAGKVYRF